MGMYGDAVYRISVVEPCIERGREEIFNAFRGDADNDRPPAHERLGIFAVHDFADASVQERIWAAAIIEKHLVAPAVEPCIDSPCVVERHDHAAAQMQLVAETRGRFYTISFE